jgi:predicted ester cyclase
MSVETARQVMDGYLKALVGGGDFSSFFADDVVWETPETGDRVVGREAVRDFIVTFHREVFDARPDLKHLVVAEDAAFVEADFVGTHTGEFAGIPATGAKVRIPTASPTTCPTVRSRRCAATCLSPPWSISSGRTEQCPFKVEKLVTRRRSWRPTRRCER